MSGRAQLSHKGKFFLRVLLLSLTLLVLIQPRPALAQLSTNDPVGFFTNVADRLLKTSTAEWLAADFTVYTNTFKTDQAFGVTNIPVFINGQMVYSPAVHRLLQVAANLWDTLPNARAAQELPTVFRPRFVVQGENIYICDFVEEPTFDSIVTNTAGREIIDIMATNNPAAMIPTDGNVQIFGVPLVVGVRKGLPNFNEFQFETIFTLTRKIQLRRAGGVLDQTNQFFTMSLTMPSAAEFWNSYSSNYLYAANPGVIITITNRATMTMTNDLGISFTRTFVTGDRFATNGEWSRFRASDTKSFFMLMRTNVPFLPTIGYLPGTGFVNATNQNLYDTSQNLLMPRWGITISNRVHAMILRPDSSIIDYVLLGNMVYTTNLTEIIASSSPVVGNSFEQLWATNASSVGPDFISGRLGVEQQINISLGSEGYPPTDSLWHQFGTFGPSTPLNEIARFRDIYFYSTSNGLFNVPFTPTIQFRVPMIWQVNDPLVHYNANDLFYMDRSEKVFRMKPPVLDFPGDLANVGKLNDRYQPWDLASPSSSPNGRELSLKDSLVTSSDNWQFPTNESLAIESLGKVHRGTPWQTIYLKADDVGGVTNRVNSPTEWAQSSVFNIAAQRWAKWNGHPKLEEGFYTRPVCDRSLLVLLTAMIKTTNDPRQLLSVNDRTPENWLAVLNGLTVLTNTGPTNILARPQFEALTITSNSTQALLLADAIAVTRANQPGQMFRSVGDLLATPELTVASPWLNPITTYQQLRGMTDAAYEIIPAQLLSLVRADSIGEIRSGVTKLVLFSGFNGYPYTIESSSNLVNWTSVSTNYPTNGVFMFMDGPATGEKRFYRSVLLP